MRRRVPRLFRLVIRLRSRRLLRLKARWVRMSRHASLLTSMLCPRRWKLITPVSRPLIIPRSCGPLIPLALLRVSRAVRLFLRRTLRLRRRLCIIPLLLVLSRVAFLVNGRSLVCSVDLRRRGSRFKVRPYFLRPFVLLRCPLTLCVL